MRNEVDMSIAKLTALAATYPGGLLFPGADEYERARQLHNGLIDKRPAVIAPCRNSAEVIAALDLADRSGLEISVRGGGHSIAGRSAVEGGLMIDLSLMSDVAVDSAARTVRVEGGAIWAKVNEEAARQGLATTGGVISTTGVGGLTLGGGMGWGMASWGLAVDNLLSVEVVLADGRLVTADENTHPDLFWAVRGGGGNFGIVTSFLFRLHPVAEIWGGLVAHPFEGAAHLFRFLAEYSTNASDDLTVMPLLVHAPDGSGTRLAATAVAHFGPPEKAAADLRPLLEFGSPILSQVGPISYPDLNTMLDDGFPPGALYYWKSNFIPALTDDVIDVMIEQFAACPSNTSGIAVEHLHGAATRVPVNATAFPHRRPGYNILLAGVWSDAQTNDENIGWTKETYRALRPLLGAGRYVNYLSDDDSSAISDAYGPNLSRLTTIKRQYDPDNRFHLNHNIEPAR
jgi:FAD/FMN-containing dehydrogenase